MLLKLHAFLDFAAPENVGLSQGAAQEPGTAHGLMSGCGDRGGLRVGVQRTSLLSARTDPSDVIKAFDLAACASGRLDLATNDLYDL